MFSIETMALDIGVSTAPFEFTDIALDHCDLPLVDDVDIDDDTANLVDHVDIDSMTRILESQNISNVYMCFMLV